MRQIRKSTVEPIEVELLDGSKVLLRATAWIFRSHFKGFRAADMAALDQFDAMLEFIYDCVLDKDAMSKEQFMQQVPFDMAWISELFAAIISVASPERPTQPAPPATNPTGSNTSAPPESISA